MLCGGFQAVTEISSEHTDIASSKRSAIETMLAERGRNGKVEHFEVVEVQQQVVAGMVFLFKIRLQQDGDECVFVKIFRDLSNTAHVGNIAFNKRLSDDLTHAALCNEE